VKRSRSRSGSACETSGSPRVVEALEGAGARRVLDLGCGDGRLLQALLRVGSFERGVGVDVSFAALERAARRLHLHEMSPKQRERVELLQSSLTFRDRRLRGFDAAALVEVIEHLDPSRLGAFERVLFEGARPSTIVITTPSAEYNVRFEGLPAGSLRHRDHRFEWTRAEFREWAGRTAERHGYAVRFLGVGPEDDPAAGRHGVAHDLIDGFVRRDDVVERDTPEPRSLRRDAGILSGCLPFVESQRRRSIAQVE